MLLRLAGVEAILPQTSTNSLHKPNPDVGFLVSIFGSLGLVTSTDSLPFHLMLWVWIHQQGRRHGFESGGQILRAKRAENFFDPHFLASGGQNIT